MAAVLAGHQQAFAGLVRLYQGRIYAMARGYFRNPEEASDVAQEVFLAVFASLPRFDRSRPFRHWLLRIATNHCIQHLRRKTRPPLPPDPPAPLPDPLEVQVQNEERERVRQAMDRLDEDLRDVVIHYYLLDQSCPDIAETLGITLSLVKVRLLRARRAMVVILKELEAIGSPRR